MLLLALKKFQELIFTLPTISWLSFMIIETLLFHVCMDRIFSVISQEESLFFPNILRLLYTTCTFDEFITPRQLFQLMFNTREESKKNS